MTPVLEGTQTGEDTFKVEVRPDNGIPVTLYVVPWPGSERWYVKRSPEPTSMGFISKHNSFERAANSALYRARKYLASYARTARRQAVKSGAAA